MRFRNHEVVNNMEKVFTVGIVACLNKHQQFLIAKRGHTDKIKPGFWEWPGGHIDPEDSSIAAGAARELFEEVNLLCDPQKLLYLGYQEVKRPLVEDSEITAVVYRHYYLALEWENEPKIVPNPHNGILEHDDWK